MVETTPVEAFLEAVREGKIRGYECAGCGHRQVTPIVYCPKCHGADLRVVDLNSTGRIVSYTVQRLSPEAFINETPFAWVIVDLDGGGRVTGWIPFVAGHGEISLGERVRFNRSYRPGIVFERVGERD
ncbi:MAG: Zn-ribbon domain-containing OB-fold protein [Candidatus Geothermarchaeales archaeon]